MSISPVAATRPISCTIPARPYPGGARDPSHYVYRLPVTPPDARPLLGHEVRSAVARYAAARGIRVCVVRGSAKLMGAAVAEWRGKYGGRAR